MTIRDRITELRRVRAGDLKPNPHNWREHPEAQRAALEGVLAEVGYADALLARELPDGSLELVDGHLRADLDPEQEVPVLILDLDEAEAAKLLTVLDPLAGMAEANEEALGKLLAEIETESEGLAAMLAELTADNGLGLESVEVVDVEPQLDRAAELQEKWGTETGQLWVIPSKTVEGGEHRVLCGDSTKAEDVARLMGGGKADICVSDPPYGVLDVEWDRAFTQEDLDMIFAATAGMVACFNAAKPQVLHSMLSLVPQPERVGVWRYSHIAPKPGMIWSWQPVFYWRCGDAVAWDSLDWFQGNADKDGSHPTQKPVAFFQKIISSIDCISVYDPFLGSGTTLIAAEQLGRLCYGLEIEPKYVAVILERMTDLGLTPRLE